MNSNTEARRSRTWMHAKRAPAPLDANKVADTHRFHRYDEQSADGNGTGADAEASPLIIIPDTILGGTSNEGPGPEAIHSLSNPNQFPSDGVPSETSTTATSTADSITFPSSVASNAESSAAAITATPTAGAQLGGTAVVSSGSLGTSHSNIPGVAIGLVVAALVVALMAVVVFFMRRRSIRAREQKRQTWNKNIFTKQQEARAEQEKVFTVEQPAPAYEAIVAPPMSYNAILPPTQAVFAPRPVSETSVTATTRRSLTHPAPPPMPSAPPATPASTAASVNTDREETTRANICCTFIPCLPDELSISTGETVRVLARYDDGWAMCVNGTGEQGMVPTECLDSGNGRVGSGDWRASRRVSSLPRSRY